MDMRKREREREREGETEKGRETDRDRQRQRQTERDRDREERVLIHTNLFGSLFCHLFFKANPLLFFKLFLVMFLYISE